MTMRGKRSNGSPSSIGRGESGARRQQEEDKEGEKEAEEEEKVKDNEERGQEECRKVSAQHHMKHRYQQITTVIIP